MTSASIELFRKGLPSIKWPLKSLRRYGLDAEHFTFEAGRRCQTGPGVYAFKCSRAQQLFELVQNHVRLSSEAENARRASVGRVIMTSREADLDLISTDLPAHAAELAAAQDQQYVNVILPRPAEAAVEAEMLSPISSQMPKAYYENVVLGSSHDPNLQQPDERSESSAKINYVQLELTARSAEAEDALEANNNHQSEVEDGHDPDQVTVDYFASFLRMKKCFFGLPYCLVIF